MATGIGPEMAQSLGMRRPQRLRVRSASRPALRTSTAKALPPGGGLADISSFCAGAAWWPKLPARRRAFHEPCMAAQIVLIELSLSSAHVEVLPAANLCQLFHPPNSK
jgi:hypothetical protein